MGHIKFFRGTTGTIYYQLLSIPKTNGNKHERLGETLIHGLFILSVDYNLCIVIIIFTGIIFFPSKKTHNKFESFFSYLSFSPSESKGRGSGG